MCRARLWLRAYPGTILEWESVLKGAYFTAHLIIMASPASLRRFHLECVRDTGRVIGEGAYAVVKELEFRGLKCVGKKLHAVLYENASREWRADMLQR